MSERDPHRHLQKTGFALLGFAFAFSVFAFGSTIPWTIRAARLLVFTATAVLGIDLLWRRAGKHLFAPRLLLLWLPILLLIGQLILLTTNAHFDHSMETWKFVARERWHNALPGSMVYRATYEALWTQVSLLLLLWVLTIHLRERQALRYTVWIIAGVAIAFTLLGLGQKALGYRAMYGLEGVRHGMFFGTYRSHNNAGSFFLLTLPFCLALFIHALQAGRRNARSNLFWGTASLLVLTGWMVTPSRAAFVIGVCTFGTLLFLNRRLLASRLKKSDRPQGEVRTTRILIGAIIVAGMLIGAQQIGPRWQAFFSSEYWPLTKTLRWQAYQAEWPMVLEAGWFGQGPGTFKHLFPYYTHNFEDRLSGVWLFAHQDYLETLIEWGRFGAVCWGLLLLGAFGWCLRVVIAGKRMFSRERVLLTRGALVALAGVLLHALVDFPFQIYSLKFVALMIAAMGWSAAITSWKAPDPKPSKSE